MPEKPVIYPILPIYPSDNQVGREKTQSLLQSVLKLSKADMTEAVLEKNGLVLTRFAESKIHQNIDTEDTTLYVRMVKDKKLSVVATGDISESGIKKAVEAGEDMLKYMLPDDKFVSFPSPDSAVLKENSISEGTSTYGPDRRAEAVKLIDAIGRKGSLEASGAFRIEEKSLAVANSLGVQRFFNGNNAQLSLTLSGKEKESGWAIGYDRDASLIDVGGLAKRAAQKAVLSRNPISLPDGQYTVILEPAAVGQLLILLAFMGFGAKTFSQQRSFMAGKIGQKIGGDNFTVYEDPADPAFGTMPFDYEGVSKVKVPLIENGLARGVVSNSYYANIMGTTSTGNALPANNSFGPYPKNMVVAPGEKTLDEIIQSTEKGILITHFWYLNYLNPMKTMVTGTTRDGTYLIEKGQIGSAVKNMRTNQSILEAFTNIAAIGKESIIYPQYSVLMKVPGMKIDNFNLAAEEDQEKC